MMEFIRKETKIDKVLSLGVEYKNNDLLLINANCLTKYGEENFVIAKVFKDWKCQGNYTYFKGTNSEKEYKTVKPVLKAVYRWAEKINTDVSDLIGFDFDLVLKFAGLIDVKKQERKFKKAMDKKVATKIIIDNEANEEIAIENDKQTNNNKIYYIKDTQLNREFKNELIGKQFNGVASGEYIGLNIDNNIVWILKSEVMEVNPSSTPLNIETIIKYNHIKIKLLDRKINRILDKRDIIKYQAEKKNIKLNDRNNILVNKLFEYDIIIDKIENRIDNIRKDIARLRNIQYKISVDSLILEYDNNKYKVINNIDNSILYSNDINNYINNKDYTIKVLINNTEYLKQYIDKSTENFIRIYLHDTLKVIEFKKNDTIPVIEKEYNLNSNNNIVFKVIEKKKGSIRFHYQYVCLNKKPLILINSIDMFKYNKTDNEIDTINKCIDVFKNDNEISKILYDYNEYIYLKGDNIKKLVPICKQAINIQLDYWINEYSSIINKFKDLKRVMQNLKYYNNIYKDRVIQFYKDFKTNSKYFANYMHNYSIFNKLLEFKGNNNISDGYKFKAPEKVVYTIHYRKGLYY